MFDSSAIHDVCCGAGVVFLLILGWAIMKISKRKPSTGPDGRPYPDFEDAKPRDYTRDSEFK